MENIYIVQNAKRIMDLRWLKMLVEELLKTFVLSKYNGIEFAESLRICLKHYPESHAFQEMAKGELNTDNLRFGSYQRRGDHWEFLQHFIQEYGLIGRFPEVEKKGEEYLQKVRALSPELRIMSVVSRERELPGIFERILKAPNWSAPGLSEFQYYLEQHIFLDSSEGGHADLLNDFVVDSTVEQFYGIRLDSYTCIPVLFSK